MYITAYSWYCTYCISYFRKQFVLGALKHAERTLPLLLEVLLPWRISSCYLHHGSAFASGEHKILFKIILADTPEELQLDIYEDLYIVLNHNHQNRIEVSADTKIRIKQ